MGKNMARLSIFNPYYNIRKIYISKENTMPQSKVTSKGQITIPVEMRNDLNIDSGDVLEFVKVAEGRYEVMVGNSKISEIKGLFGKVKKGVSVDEMRNAIIKKVRLMK
jgi:antitoxin PrlF